MIKILWLVVLLTSAAIADQVRVSRASSGPPRTLDLAGAPNFRDVGGYVTAHGGHVRWGRVYRSNEISRLTAGDAEKVDNLHIVSVVDLRTEEERARAPSTWIHTPADVYQSPQPTLAPLMHSILREAQTTAGARAGLINFYAHMPDQYRVEYTAMFHEIATGRLPLLVHCTAGKDRTGVAMALLLRTLGVPRKLVIDDYALTEKLLPQANGAIQGAAPVGAPAQAALGQLPEGSRRALWRSDPAYIRAALDSVDREYGSVTGYLRRGLGLSTAEVSAVRGALIQ